MNTQYGQGDPAILLQKWKPLLEAQDADLKPLDTKRKAVMTAVLLENQYNYMRNNPEIYGRVPELVTEDTALQAGGVGVFTGYDPANPVDAGAYGNQVNPASNDFYAKGDARLPNVIMPMIRRTFPELLANEIVGIQPMNAPVGLAFALRFKYIEENLGENSPDNGPNPNPDIKFPNRGDGQEASHNYLNTRHTGVSSSALSGLGVQGAGATSATDFAFIPEDQGVANLLSSLEMSTALPQMSMGIEKTAVSAGSRKLAIKYSIELEQDLMNMHGISVDDEMTSMMSYELQAEIDREILLRMLNVSLSAGPKKGYSTWSPAEADGRWSAERSVNLWQAIRVQARLISLRNRRGSANFAVVTPYACSILETLPNFKPFTIDGNVDQQFGNSRAGTLGAIKVFVDTRTEAQYQGYQDNQFGGSQAIGREHRVDYILLGYKGTESWDSGLIYLPYIPVMVQRTMGPNDFSPRIGLSTRYAIASSLNGASNFYHTIILKDLTDGFDDTTGVNKKFLW